MTKQGPIKVGIMGFGQTGRQLFELASRSNDVEVVAIADIGKPDILHYLLSSEVEDPGRHKLEGNFLTNDRCRARLMEIDRPAEMPWDILSIATRRAWRITCPTVHLESCCALYRRIILIALLFQV